MRATSALERATLQHRSTSMAILPSTVTKSSTPMVIGSEIPPDSPARLARPGQLELLEPTERMAQTEPTVPMARPDRLVPLALQEPTELMERLERLAQQAQSAPPVHLPFPSTVRPLIIIAATSASGLRF